jgi:aquaporin Z|mmetsp:Transcript_38076/g.60304  ORF Transcript_38076/g.60304 Transcript_38076/m.60304 type:complete len:464 (-) Transcript_38076:45-1436(-)
MGEIKNVPAKVVAEFTGTFLLIFTVGCNVLSQTPVWAGVSIASVLMVVIYAFGGISGGNFNPAVSVMLGIVGSLKGPNGMEWKEVAMYCGVQIAAGILAGFCYFGMFGHTFNLEPAKGFSWFDAGLCELLYTFMLCFVVLNVAVTNDPAVKGEKDANGKQPGNSYYGLAIGFVVVAGAYGAGAVSGGCFNPAVAIGIDVSSAHLGIGWSLVYTAFELVGCALAAVLFKVVRPGDFGGVYDDKKTMVPKLTSEFLGTYILVLTVGLNVLGKSPAAAFSIAASLMCMIYALGDVSGANFNPAVSLALVVFGEMESQEAGMYMAAQIAGGVAAAFTYAGVYYGETFPLGPGAAYGWTQALTAELVFTFVLCMIVLTVAVSEKNKNGTMFGLAIGSCVTVGGFAIGSISGGSLNPAVSLGISAAHVMNGGFFFKALLYSLVEFAGGAAAAGLVIHTHGKNAKKAIPQ